MTYGELMLIIKTNNEMLKTKAKETLINNYTLATMVSSFVNKQLNGKPIPKVEEMYPRIFMEDRPKEEKETLTKTEYNRAMMMKEMFIDFANRRNELLRNKEGEIIGDRTTQSQDNC